MDPITIAMLVIAVVELAIVAYDAYNAPDSQDIATSVSKSVDNQWQQIYNFLQDFAKEVADALRAILQYMDAWGTIVVVLFAVVIVILLAMFYNVAKLRRKQ